MRNIWGQQLYFLNTKHCLIFASAKGEDSERLPRYRLGVRTLTMPFSVFKGSGVVGVRVAVVAEMRV